jgi:preprotein translocase subunit SecD
MRIRRRPLLAAVLAVPALPPAPAAAKGGAVDDAPIVLVAPDAEIARASVAVLRRRLAALGLDAAEVTAEGAQLRVALPRGTAAAPVAAVLVRPGRLSMHRQATATPAAPVLELPWPDHPDGRLRLAASPALDGDIVARSSIRGDPMGNFDVMVELRPEAAERFHDLTRQALDEVLAVVLDGAILIAPTIRTPIPGGRIAVSGRFTRSEAQQIAALLAGGALPGPLRAAPGG